MLWLKLNRQTGEAGGSDFGTVPIWLNVEAIQFVQAQRAGTRIYLRSGAIESIDVIETPDEVVRRSGGNVGVNDQNPAVKPVIAPDLSTPTDSRLPVVVKSQP
jgi:hypothetical protein